MSPKSAPLPALCFERTARELNPRWTPAGLVVRASGLSAETRALLERGLGRSLPRDTPRAWWCIEEPLARVDERAEPDDVVRLLARTARNATLAPSEPLVAGIVNVTPDSFSDGGRFLDPTRAIEHGLALVADGADALDVGGESTRPGSEPVAAAEEEARVVPVVAGLRAAGVAVPISVDTQKSAVAAAALEAGATWVNDVSAGRTDPGMLALVAERGCDLCLMHMQGTPRDMQRDPTYRDVVDEVLAFLRERVAACLKAGIDLSRITLDPGIGFGKRLEHNLELLRRLSELRSLGLPLYLGVSRKSFIARVNEAAGRPARADERVGGTAAAVAACVAGGARWLRVHDVRTMLEAARVARALQASTGHSGREG